MNSRIELNVSFMNHHISKSLWWAVNLKLGSELFFLIKPIVVLRLAHCYAAEGLPMMPSFCLHPYANMNADDS